MAGGARRMSASLPGATIDLEYESRYSYRCEDCRRSFVVVSRQSHEEGSVRCPTCLSDAVLHRRSRRERLMQFLMMYEAA